MNSQSVGVLNTYIVLRSTPEPSSTGRFAVDAADVFLGPMATHSRLPEVPSIGIEIVDSAGARQLSNEASTVSITPAMPVKLVAPMEVGEVALPATGTAAWGVAAVRAQLSSFTGDGIVLAVLDTGIDASHPAFSGVELIQRDFTGEGNEDKTGHGTHCAGTILGRTIDGMRIGVATGVKKALIGKVLGTNSGSTCCIVQAIQWAVSSGAHIISMSLGIDFPGMVELLRMELPPQLATSRALEAYRLNIQLFEKLAALVKAQGAFGHPTIIVSAAGNESRRETDSHYVVRVGPPAVVEGIISVAALDQGPNGLKIAPFSNAGANVCGPGVQIVSAKAGGGLAALSGTSMAAPHVAGVAALWAEKLLKEGQLTGFQLSSRLNGSATTEGLEPGFDASDIGLGLVRAPN
jgi:subtilisin family serine protease